MARTAHTTHAVVPVAPDPAQSPEVIRFMWAMFNIQWQRRPLDMPYGDVVNLKHPGIALNYVRTQLNFSREQMARLLFLGTNNYTQIEIRGTPLKQPVMQALADLCLTRGMVNLSKYFELYLGIKKRNSSRGNRV